MSFFHSFNGLLFLLCLQSHQNRAAPAAECIRVVPGSITNTGWTDNIVEYLCPTVYVFDGVTFTGGSSGLIARNSTLLPGGSPAVISHLTFSLGPSANSLAVDGTLTPLTQQTPSKTPAPGSTKIAGSPSTIATLSIYTVYAILLTGNPTSLVSGSNTLTPGATPVTISSHTLSIPTSATGGQISVDGTLTPLPPQAPASSPTKLASLSSHTATVVDEILDVTSTDTVPPANLSTQLISTPWTSNTWLTATISGQETIVPVLVGCAHCGGTGRGVIIWNYPRIPRVTFQFPKLPNGDIVDPFHLPCVPIPFINNCPSPPINDPPVDGAVSGANGEPKTPDPTSPDSNTPSSTSSSATSSTSSRPKCSFLCSACANNHPPSSYPSRLKVKKRIPPHPEKFLSAYQDAAKLKKRVLASPGDAPYNGNLDAFLFDQIALAEDAGNVVDLRVSGIQGISSALAIELRANPLNMAVQGMRGCTSVIIVSKGLVWGSHLWEHPAFDSGAIVFKNEVIDVLGPGDGSPEMPGLIQYTGDGGRLAPETNPQAFIVTPGFVSGSGNMFFPGQVSDITDKLKEVLGHTVPVTPILYDPVDIPEESGSDSGSDVGDEWTPNGRILFQYDPGDLVPERCKGLQTATWKLWADGEPRAQGSWTATDEQIIADRKRQEIDTVVAAVCSASSTISSSKTDPSGVTYAVYFALKILDVEVNQPNGLPPIDDVQYFHEVWETVGDSKPDYCKNPTKSMMIFGTTPDTQNPYPDTTITSLQPSGTSGPTCTWFPGLSDPDIIGIGHLSCNVNPTVVACLPPDAQATACGYGAQVYPGVQCVWQGD